MNGDGTKKICSTCAHSCPHPDFSEESGRLGCRRYPPVPVANHGALWTRTPEVKTDGWCGEWTKREAGADDDNNDNKERNETMKKDRNGTGRRPT